MDNIDKKIKDILSKKIQAHENFHNTITSTIQTLEEKKQFRNINLKMSLATVCCSLFLITGVVFASDIKEFISQINIGPKSTIDNGYIGFNENNYITQNALITKKGNTTNSDIGINLGYFLMTNNSLNMQFEINFDESINEYLEINRTDENFIDYENFYNIKFTNFFILDEENTLIYSPYSSQYGKNDKDLFETFCNKMTLNYSYGNFNEKYLLSLFNSNITNIDDTSNKISLDCTVSSNNLPKSKKLKIFLQEIQFIPKEIENTSNKVILTGEWEFNLNVPEIMYNRDEISYKVLNCSNSEIMVKEAKATDINFELEIEVNNVEEPIYPDKMRQIDEIEMAKNNGEMSIPNTKDKFLKLYPEDCLSDYEKYLTNKNLISLDGDSAIPWKKTNIERCYITNSNGEKFEIAGGCYGNFKYDVTHDDMGISHVKFLNEYFFNFKFDMTKYNATDIISVIINYKGEPVFIELEKI